MSEIGNSTGLTIQCSKIVQELECTAQRIRIRQLDPAEPLKICHASGFQAEETSARSRRLISGRSCARRPN